MNRSEFLQRLREALENDLNGSVVQENIDYYNNYIASEVRNGHLEDEVIQELGDPWMLARTVIDASGTEKQEYLHESQEHQRKNGTESAQRSMYIFGLNTWWKKLLAIVSIVLIVITVFSIITGIVSLVAPILLPILMVVIVVRIISRRR